MVRKAKNKKNTIKIEGIMNKEVYSVKETLEYLYALSLDKHEKYCFRGQCNSEWKIMPSIFRGIARHQSVFYEDLLLELEPRVTPLSYTGLDLEWLMLCQHYGIQTRLLDWTTDILTALFFACHSDTENLEKKNGSIFICNQNDYKNFTLYDKSIMESQELSFINSYIVNPRIRSQHGCFMIWGHEETDTYDLKSYITKNKLNYLLDEIIIPFEAKKDILKELEEKFSITKKSIYLENSKIEINKEWDKIKTNLKILTLYITKSDELSSKDKEKIETHFGRNFRSMFEGCINIRSIKLKGLLTQEKINSFLNYDFHLKDK